MSEQNGNGIIGKNDANTAAQPETRIVMQIELTKEGQMKVSSPFIQDKTVCYGLLELAKDAVRDHHKPQIVKPNGGIMNFIRNHK